MDFFGKLAVACLLWAIFLVLVSIFFGIEEMTWGRSNRKIWHTTFLTALISALVSTVLFICI